MSDIEADSGAATTAAAAALRVKTSPPPLSCSLEARVNSSTELVRASMSLNDSVCMLTVLHLARDGVAKQTVQEKRKKKKEERQV